MIKRIVFGFATLATLGALIAVTSVGAINWQAQPTFGTITLQSNFRPDPHEVPVTSGGSNDASMLGGACAGFIATAPDYDLNYTGGKFKLSISAVSDSDTTLVVFDAAGEWHCNDDYSTESGLNPGIVWDNPPSGNYNIWIGSYSRGDMASATLRISEASPTWGTTSLNRAAVEWGDNTSRWANDGECDDDRFAGPGMADILVESDRFHDAADCRRLYEAGLIYLR